MASFMAQIAQGVTDAINAASLIASSEWEAQRVYVPLSKYEDLAENQTRVQVFPVTLERQVDTRAAVVESPQINVIFMKRLESSVQPDASDATTLAILDEMIEFGEQLASAIEPGEYYGGHPCHRVEYPVAFDHEAMRSQRVFVGLITCFFSRE